MSDKRPRPTFFRRPLPSNLVELSSDEGRARFDAALRAGDAEAFFSLVSSFQTQSHPAMCGPAALAVALNALRVDPLRVWTHPWRWYDDALLTCCLGVDAARARGVTLDQLSCIARCEGAQVRVMRENPLEDVRAALRAALRTRAGEPDAAVVLACYDRAVLSQTGSGHFSPIAAYHEETDSVLVLDVARFKYAPHWVDLSLLVSSTESVDPTTGRPRGFVMVSNPKVDDKSRVNNCNAAINSCVDKGGCAKAQSA